VSPASTAPPSPYLVGYQPHELLTTVRAGDSKEKVFEVLATSYEQRSGSLVRIEGIRRRAGGRSATYEHVEVADARFANTPAGTLYWFLFGDGRLLAWGQAGEWAAAASHHQVESDYRPAVSRER